MKWFQHELSITAPSRGCHLITSNVQKVISNDLSQIKVGMCNLFVQHTSASLTINENADPDVRRDLEVALNKIVPASWNHDGTFKHTMEGDDDMPVRYCYLELCMCVVFCKSFLRSLLFCFLFRLHFLVIIRDTWKHLWWVHLWIFRFETDDWHSEHGKESISTNTETKAAGEVAIPATLSSLFKDRDDDEFDNKAPATAIANTFVAFVRRSISEWDFL